MHTFNWIWTLSYSLSRLEVPHLPSTIAGAAVVPVFAKDLGMGASFCMLSDLLSDLLSTLLSDMLSDLLSDLLSNLSSNLTLSYCNIT